MALEHLPELLHTLALGPHLGVGARLRPQQVVREVLTDPARFSSAAGVGLTDLRHGEAWQRPSVILEVDPPEHTVTRRVLNRVLSPSAMRELRADFQAVADRLVGELVEERERPAPPGGTPYCGSCSSLRVAASRTCTVRPLRMAWTVAKTIATLRMLS